MTIPAGTTRVVGRANIGPNASPTISRAHLELTAHEEVGNLTFKVVSRVNGIHVVANEGPTAGQKVKVGPGGAGELHPGDIVYLDDTIKLLVRMPPRETDKDEAPDCLPPETQSTQPAELARRSSSSSSASASAGEEAISPLLPPAPPPPPPPPTVQQQQAAWAMLGGEAEDDGQLLRTSRKRAVDERALDGSGDGSDEKRPRPASSLPAGINTIRYTDLKAVDLIGKGTCSNVFRATWNGTQVAVKRILRSLTTKGLEEGFEVESAILFRLRHPNVVTLYGVCEHNGQMLLVTELMARGSLRTLLDDASLPLPWSQRLAFVRDAAAGMNYLHSFDGCKAIIHRDVKSANFLVGKDWTVKVADFGISRVLDSEDELRKTFCGTLAYCAPEILLGQPYTLSVDVFSFGIVMWEVLTRKEPYAGVPPAALRDAVAKAGRRPPIDQATLERCPRYCELLVRCLIPNPDLRPTFSKILQTIAEITRLHVLAGST